MENRNQKEEKPQNLEIQPAQQTKGVKNKFQITITAAWPWASENREKEEEEATLRWGFWNHTKPKNSNKTPFLILTMGEKKNAEQDTTTAVFKIDIHCEGCANKIRKSVREIPGVDRVRADWEANKLTVTGKFDTAKLRENLADKTKKKIDIVSSESKKEKESKKPDDDKQDKKTEDKKPKEKETPVTTATLKVELHCQGCIEKIYKVVSRTKGVEDMAIERQKDLVMVKGKMDVKALIENLEEKLKRKVAVVVPKKEKDDGAKGGDGGDKSKSGGEVAQEGGVTEGNRLDYVAVPVPGYGYGYGYGNGGFVGQPLPSPQHLLSPQMFSDENPNACSIM